MTIQLGLGTLALAGFLALLIFWLGALAEYFWHAIHHRRR